MTDEDVHSNESCPKCGVKQWWFYGAQYDERNGVIIIMSHCSKCDAHFVQTKQAFRLNVRGHVEFTDSEVIEMVVKAVPAARDVAAIFLRKNWKERDMSIIGYHMTPTPGYHFCIAKTHKSKGQSGWDVPSMLMAKIALLMIRDTKSSKTTAEIAKHCVGHATDTVNHALRFMVHIGILSRVRRGLYIWSFEPSA